MSAPENHPVLDHIAADMLARREFQHSRESECVEFKDGEQWYEIVVRPIDSPDAE